MATTKAVSNKTKMQIVSDPDSSVLGTPEGPLPCPVFLRVTLWAPKNEGKLSEFPLAMVDDLFSVSDCEMTESSSSCVAAIFQGMLQAVRVARQVQQLVASYCSALADTSFGICSTLSNSDEVTPIVNFHLFNQIQTVAAMGPGQTLLVGKLCENARSIPGLKLQALSGGLVTRDEQGSARAVLHLLPPTLDEVPVSDPFKLECPAVQLTTKTISKENDELPQGTPRKDNPSGTIAIASGPNSGDASENKFDALIRSKQKGYIAKRTPSFWAGVGIASTIVLVFASSIIRVSTRRTAVHSGTPATVSTGSKTSSTPFASPSSPSTTNGQSPAAPTTRSSSGIQPSIGLPARDASFKARKAGERNASSPDTAGEEEAQKQHSQPQITWDQAEIFDLLERADRLSGDGNFDRAIISYRTILKHDPSNTRAREGLDRAIRNKKSQER